MDVCEGKAMEDLIRGVCVRCRSSSYAQTYTPTEDREEGFKYLSWNRLQEVIHS